MRQITIAVDSFKGSLSSYDVACAAEQGIHSALPHCKVKKISIADGGEGTARETQRRLREAGLLSTNTYGTVILESSAESSDMVSLAEELLHRHW